METCRLKNKKTFVRGKAQIMLVVLLLPLKLLKRDSEGETPREVMDTGYVKSPIYDTLGNCL
jgi:hypothetical protein